jgi:hypothetical protein
MKNFIRLFLTVAFVGFVVAPAFAQTQDRIMIFDRLCDEPAAESEDEDSDCLVELIDIQIDGKKITSGKPFIADENWMKNLKVRIRNVSGKPFVAVGLSFGLIEGLYEELAPSASWSWAFGFHRGKSSNPYDENRKISNVVILKPNKEIELTFDDLPELYKKSSLMQVVGKQSQIVFISATVEFKDGKQEDSELFIKKKQK